MPRASPALLLSLAIAALALVPAAVKVVAYPGYPGFDDAFIHLAIVKNFVEGHGWGANPGHPANMTSCPLYTLVMAALTLGFGHEIRVGMLLSAVLGSVALLLLYRTVRLLGLSPTMALIATTVGAFDFALWRWYGTVMETTMTFLMLGVVLYVYYRGFSSRSRGNRAMFALGLLLGMAVLVRIELAVMAPAIAADHWLNRKQGAVRRLSWVAVGAVVAMIPWLWFAWHEFGDIVPTTYYSKTGVGFRLWNPTVLGQMAAVIGSSHGVPILFAAAAVAVGVRRGRAKELVRVLRSRAAVFLVPVLYLAFYYAKTDYLGSAARYVLPALWVVPIGIVLLIRAAVPEWTSARARLALITALALHVGVNGFVDVQRVQPVLRGFADNYWRVMRETAEYLAERCEPSDHVLVIVDIGILAYYGQGRYHIDDAFKLASPELRHVEFHDLIDHVKPRFVVETQGTPRGIAPRLREEEYLAEHPELELVRTSEYAAHGIADPDRHFACRVFRYRRL